MNRKEAIQTIEALFPADAEYPDTAKIGQRLLERAEREMVGWRTKPDEILIRYAELCLQEENRQEREFNRKWKKEREAFGLRS